MVFFLGDAFYKYATRSGVLFCGFVTLKPDPVWRFAMDGGIAKRSFLLQTVVIICNFN
jgi:hypothetical protein